MGIQQNINNIAKLGFYLDILIDDHGLIAAGIYTKPKVPDGVSYSILEPVNEIGNDLDEVLSELVKRLNKHIAMESKNEI